jgi:hypothetical protein
MTRVIAFVIAVLIPTAVFAKSVCEDDLGKFCRGLETRAQKGACLDQNPNVSAACKAARQAAKSCAEDLEKFCKETKGWTKRNECLDKHQAELSAGCKTSREAQAKPQQ